jgi:hypothetical protein
VSLAGVGFAGGSSRGVGAYQLAGAQDTWAAPHIVPTQNRRCWAGVSFGRPSRPGGLRPAGRGPNGVR